MVCIYIYICVYIYICRYRYIYICIYMDTIDDLEQMVNKYMASKNQEALLVSIMHCIRTRN